MARIYWIEDEPDRLPTVFEMLEDEVGANNVRSLKSASEVRGSFAEIKANPGPILLDLQIPTGDPTLPADQQRGPQVGLVLLQDLLKELGEVCPIFIVSGNVSFMIMEDLIQNFRIPSERIFTKPLMSQKAELLVNEVVALAKKCPQLDQAQ